MPNGNGSIVLCGTLSRENADRTFASESFQQNVFFFTFVYLRLVVDWFVRVFCLYAIALGFS